ncbi:MAG: 3-hydroxyacyl-CoA dehydrogenase family protein [Ferruginibacter sp.]
MRIAVLANDDQWKEINTGIGHVDYFRMNSIRNIPAGVEAYLLLQDVVEWDFEITSNPVLINAVSFTLTDIKAAANVVRINGWNGFLSRSAWEMAGSNDNSVKRVFAALGKQIIQVPDEPGFVSARVIAMIINEAYFALEDKISSREEIDIAMKLGTNYPYGPFEWASIIGVDKIFALLQKLYKHDTRYLPANLLKAAATAWV